MKDNTCKMYALNRYSEKASVKLLSDKENKKTPLYDIISLMKNFQIL